MRFYLVRHGQASQVAPSDEQRPLTPHGHEMIEATAQLLHRMQARPSVIYCSPRLRAQQTAKIIADAFELIPQTTPACDFNFSVEKAFELIVDLPEEAAPMFVGHNPTMSATISALSGAAVDVAPGTVACIDYLYPPGTYGAVLSWLLAPSIVKAAQ